MQNEPLSNLDTTFLVHYFFYQFSFRLSCKFTLKLFQPLLLVCVIVSFTLFFPLIQFFLFTSSHIDSVLNISLVSSSFIISSLIHVNSSLFIRALLQNVLLDTFYMLLLPFALFTVTVFMLTYNFDNNFPVKFSSPPPSSSYLGLSTLTTLYLSPSCAFKWIFDHSSRPEKNTRNTKYANLYSFYLCHQTIHLTDTSKRIRQCQV